MCPSESGEYNRLERGRKNHVGVSGCRYSSKGKGTGIERRRWCERDGDGFFFGGDFGFCV